VNETASKSTGPLQALLTAADFRAALGGMSERKFNELRAAGVVPLPLELGPRVARWTQDDLAETIRRLPRREKATEPTTLSQGRRARIEAMKVNAAGGSQISSKGLDRLRSGARALGVA
jgi:predicted DNA-binding transcriptional regulator AlpA